MGWVIALPALAVLWGLNKKVNPKGKAKKVVAILTMATVLVAGCALATTFVGEWFAAAVSWVAQVLTGLTGSSFAVALPVALTLLLLITVVADIAYDKKADKAAQIAGMLVPTLLLLAVGGTLGATGGQAVRTVNANMAAFFSTLG